MSKNKSMMDLIPMLETEDIHSTIQFYTKILDFDLKNTFESNGETSWIMLEWGHVGLMFTTRFEKNNSTLRMSGSLYFYPYDVRELWDRLKERVKIEWPLQTFHYGMTEFAILDNNGYRLVFGQ